MNIHPAENAIITKLKKQTRELSSDELKARITQMVKEADYLQEPWQSQYAEERILQKLSEDLRENEGPIILPHKGLIDPSAVEGKFMYIKCGHCGHVGKPSRWGLRTGIGIAHVVLTLNLIVALIYFLKTSPYICEQCGERDRLTQVLNNQKELPVKALSKAQFEILSFVLILLGAALLALRVFMA